MQSLLALGAALLFAANAYADATVQSLRGEVRLGTAGVGQSQRVFSGATLNTGPGAQAVLKFDDGQQVVLHENTTFRIADFRYREAEPRNDRAVFDLLRGALRIISGAVASRNQQAFQLRAPMTTIGIRGTDFMVAIVNPLYISVTNGAVAATNAGGTTVFGAGSFGAVASGSSLATAIPASQLPAAASSAFSSMNAAAGVVSGGMAPGATAAGAGAAGPGLGTTAAIIGGTAAVGAAALDGNLTTTHHHTPAP
jgi:ferric-dicitrate binding protein FerR (iron transport regulator)